MREITVRFGENRTCSQLLSANPSRKKQVYMASKLILCEYYLVNLSKFSAFWLWLCQHIHVHSCMTTASGHKCIPKAKSRIQGKIFQKKKDQAKQIDDIKINT